MGNRKDFSAGLYTLRAARVRYQRASGVFVK